VKNKPLPRAIRVIIAHLLHLPLIVLIALATQALITHTKLWTIGIWFIISIVVILISIKYPKYEILMRTHSVTTGSVAVAGMIIFYSTGKMPSIYMYILQSIVTWYVLYSINCWPHIKR